MEHKPRPRISLEAYDIALLASGAALLIVNEAFGLRLLILQVLAANLFLLDLFAWLLRRELIPEFRDVLPLRRPTPMAQMVRDELLEDLNASVSSFNDRGEFSIQVRELALRTAKAIMKYAGPQDEIFSIHHLEDDPSVLAAEKQQADRQDDQSYTGRSRRFVRIIGVSEGRRQDSGFLRYIQAMRDAGVEVAVVSVETAKSYFDTSTVIRKSTRSVEALIGGVKTATHLDNYNARYLCGEPAARQHEKAVELTKRSIPGGA